MGRTTVVLDDDLANECRTLTGIRKKRVLFDYALHEVRQIEINTSITSKRLV